MSNLDVLENALSFIRNDLEKFYNLIANVDNRLVNAENFLLDNGDVLNPIFSNIDDTSIFTSYSEASSETRTEPIRLEDIHLRATKPTLITPNEPILTCNVSITPISFSNFNQYFSSTLGDTLDFYVTDLPNIRNSLESNISFITDGLNLIRDSNFKIPNDFFTIQPDFRDQTIDINIRAIDSSNAYKYEQYDSFNYLSDPYIIRIVEQNIPSIIKIHPDNSNDTIIFSHTNYHIRNNLKENVLFFKTFINNIDQTSITTTPNITSIYYEYELPIDNIVFSNIDKEYYSNFNNEYYYIFDFRGSNNEPKETTVQIMTYDPLYYQYYKDKKTITNVIIQEPSPIILINESSNNFIENQEGYNSFEINYLDLFSNNVNLNQLNINYEYEIISDISLETNRFYTSTTHIKHNVIKQTSDTKILINTDYRNQNYSIIITAKHNEYPQLPTYYTINIAELEPPKPIQSDSTFNIVYEHSDTNENIDLNQYFISKTANTQLSFQLTSNTDYPLDEYANLFEITNSILTINKNTYFNSERILKKTLIITDIAYNVFETIELIFNQKALIDITNPITNLVDIYESTIINLNDYININLTSIEKEFTIESNINLISKGNPDIDPIVKNNANQFTINPDYRDEPYSLTINIKLITHIYSSFENFNFTINIIEKELTPPYLIDKYKTHQYTLSNNNFELDLNELYYNTIVGFELIYIVNPINTDLYAINGSKITFTPEYRDINYNIEIKASNLEYNIGSTPQNSLKINIIEDNPIRSLQNFTNITENIDTTLLLSNYFESKESNTLNYNIKYLNYITKTEITLRSNIDNTEPVTKIEDNKLIIIPDYRNQTYIIEIETKDSIYSTANLKKEIKVIEGIKPDIETLIENDTILTITQDYYTLNFEEYFDIRYHILPEYKEQVQLDFEIEIISRDTDLEILLFYKNNKLYYADSFGDITDYEFNIAYVNINYKIITTSQLILYKNGREYLRSQNNVLSFKPTAIGDILDLSDNLLFTINILNITTYINDPYLIINNSNKAKTSKKTINLINLTDDTAPTVIHINIFNNYNSLVKLNTKTLKLNRPIFTSLLVDNLRHTPIICNMKDLVKDQTLDISRYDFSFSILTDSNLYCNNIVEINNNEITIIPYYRNESYLIYIDVYNKDIQAISDQLVYKFVELPVLEINSYTDSFTFTSNQYIFDYSNFITNYAIEFNLELNINVLSNATYIPIDNYNIRTTRNANPFYIIDNNNKKLTINPDFRNNTYDLNLFFDITNIDKSDITKTINCNLSVPLQINEEKIPSIIYNLVPPTFDITNNESNQIINLKDFYNYKYLDYLSFETIFSTFSNEHINIVDSNLILKFDYHNCNYDIIIKVTDTFYLPYESNIDLELNINELNTIEDISTTYDFDQFINIYKIDIDIDMTELFENLTHHPNTDQQFNISLSNNKYSDNTLYYIQNTSNLKITANGKGEEYYITIESFINGSLHYENEKLSKTFRLLELPIITEKHSSLTNMNPIYFSNIYDVYSCNYPFYNNLVIEKSINRIDKYIDSFKYIPDIIQYTIDSTLNTTEFKYIKDKRNIEYDVNFNIDIDNQTSNNNFILKVIEDPPIEYKNNSNIIIEYYGNKINIKDQFKTTTNSNIIIEFKGAYEITSNIEYNEATNYISKYLIETYILGDLEIGAGPNITTNVYNPYEKSYIISTSNIVFGFWVESNIDLELNINSSEIKSINYFTNNWFYALILYSPISNSISIYSNMENIETIHLQEYNIIQYQIEFKSSNLISEINYFNNMDKKTHNALVNNIKIDLPFNSTNPYRFGKEGTPAYNYNEITNELNIILANSGKKYELLFDAYVENYENFKKLEYSVFVNEKPFIIIEGGLTSDQIYQRSMTVDITDSSSFDSPEKIETFKKQLVNSLVAKKFSKDTSINSEELKNSLLQSVIISIVDDELVLTVNPDISQSTTTDEYIADLQAILVSGETDTTEESQQIISQTITLENIDYTKLTTEDKAIIIEQTKNSLKEQNSKILDNDIIITLSGNGDKVIVSTAIKVTEDTIESVKTSLTELTEPTEPTESIGEIIKTKIIDTKTLESKVILDTPTTSPIEIKIKTLNLILDSILFKAEDVSIIKEFVKDGIKEIQENNINFIESEITANDDNFVKIEIRVKYTTALNDMSKLSEKIKNKYLASKSSFITSVPSIPLEESTKILTTQDVQIFDITLDNVDFDKLTENDKNILKQKTIESSTETIKEIRINKDPITNKPIISVVYDKPIDSSISIEPPKITEIITNFNIIKTKVNNLNTDNLLVETTQETEGTVISTITFETIEERDLDQDELIKIVKEELVEKSGETIENIETTIKMDSLGTITVESIITTTDTELVDTLILDKSSIITKVKEIETGYIIDDSIAITGDVPTIPIEITETAVNKEIKTFDILLNNLNFNDLTENDKSILIHQTRESSTGEIKEIKILKDPDTNKPIISVIYELDDPSTIIQSPTTTEIVNSFNIIKTKIDDLDTENLVLEATQESDGAVISTITLTDIEDGDLDQNELNKIVKDQIVRTTFIPEENIETEVIIDSSGFISVKSIIIPTESSSIEEITDIVINHPNLKSNIITKIKEIENSIVQITANPIIETTETKKITEVELDMPYIDTTIPRNQEIIKNKIIEDYQIEETDITIDFEANTIKLSIRQVEEISIADDYADTLQTDLIITELSSQNVIVEQEPSESSYDITKPIEIIESEETEENIVSISYSIPSDSSSLDVELVKEQIISDLGVDNKDVSVVISDGNIIIAVPQDPENPVDTEIITTSIETASVDKLLGFISEGESSATIGITTTEPKEIISDTGDDFVDFEMLIENVKYDDMDSGELEQFKITIIDLLKEKLGEDVLDIDLDDLSFLSGSLKIKIKLKTSDTLRLDTNIINKLQEVVENKFLKDTITSEILNIFKITGNLKNQLEPGKIEDDIGIYINKLEIVELRSSDVEISNTISFDNIIFDDMETTIKENIISKIKNNIESTIDSSSATIILNSNKIKISVTSNKGIYGISAIETSLNVLKDSIKTTITSIITKETGITDLGTRDEVITTVEKNSGTTIIGIDTGTISSTEQIVYTRELGNINLIEFSNIVKVSDYIEQTNLIYNIVKGSEFIVSIANDEFTIINNGNNNIHPIEITGNKESTNTKILFKFNIIETNETAINLSGDSNFYHYPLIFEQEYLLLDLYDYYRKDYINYYICNLDPTYVNEVYIINKRLIIETLNNNDIYNFTIYAEDKLKGFINNEINFNIKNVRNVNQQGQIIALTENTINKTNTDQQLIIDFLSEYEVNKSDSNIFNVNFSIEDNSENIDLIQENISISESNMRLIINPTNVKLNYTLRLYIGYKDLYTGIPINRFNRSLRYSIEETGIFSFYNLDSYHKIYNLINLTNNEITCNLIENINLHYETLNINDIKFSNINPPILSNAYYKNDINSNAYIINNNDIIFSGEYRNTSYIITIEAYFEEYSNVKLKQTFNIIESEIPEIILN